MTIQKSDLIEIIQEEIRQLINELGLCHSPSTGKFVKCSKGSVYSLTKSAAEKHRIDPKFIGRGNVTSKEPREPAKLRTPFGLNTSTKGKQGGRKKISGDDISPKYSVSKYPEKYDEDISFGMRDLMDALTLLDEDKSDDFCKKCAPCRQRWQNSFLNALNQVELANKGELKKKK